MQANSSTSQRLPQSDASGVLCLACHESKLGKAIHTASVPVLEASPPLPSHCKALHSKGKALPIEKCNAENPNAAKEVSSREEMDASIFPQKCKHDS